MNRALQLQGMAFAWLAVAVVTLSLATPGLDQRTELIVIASLIVFLGVPHGALDTIFARQVYRLRSWRGWAVAGLLYGALGACVVALWIMSPMLFLSGFLVLSAAHFSGDPGPGTHFTSRIAYGGAVIVLPALWHAGEVARLFGFLAGPEAAAMVTPWLAWLAWPWLAALAASALREFRRDRLTGVELLSAGILSSLAPPLVGFAVFFCAMHSARHILRTVDYARNMSPLLIVAAGLAPMAIVSVAALVLWFSLGDAPFEMRVVQIVFVGLAALTVPHMALVERVRLSGWMLGRGTQPVQPNQGMTR